MRGSANKAAGFRCAADDMMTELSDTRCSEKHKSARLSTHCSLGALPRSANTDKLGYISNITKSTHIIKHKLSSHLLLTPSPR